MASPEGLRSDGRFLLAVLALAAGALSIKLGAEVLSSPHEARVLETARIMRESGDWIVPKFAGEPRLQKPPLAYWGSLFAYELAGEASIQAARRIVTILGMFTLIATAALGAAIVDRRTGIYAAAVLAASLLFVGEFRQVTPDGYLCAFSTAFAALAAWAWRLKGNWAQVLWVLATFGLALALLAKGPSAYVFAALAWWGTRPSGREFAWKTALVAAFLAGLPLVVWGITSALRVPEALDIWWREVGMRLRLTGEPPEDNEDGSRSPLFYGGEMLVWLVPSTAPFLAALAPTSRAKGRIRRWFLLGLLVLIAMPSRKRAYLMPLLPVAAVLAASVLRSAETSGSRLDRAATVVQCMVFPVAALGLIGLLAAHHGWLSATVVGSSALLAIQSFAAFRAHFRGNVPVREALLLGIIGLGAWQGIHRALEDHDLSRQQLGRFIKSTVPREEAFLALAIRDPIVTYYADRTPELVDAKKLAERRSATESPLWVLTTAAEVSRRPELGVRPVATTLEGVRQGLKRRPLPVGASLVLLRLIPVR